jgi:hypothetical protein
MTPEKRFLHLPKQFWANVRLVSERMGYTLRGSGQIKVPSLDEIRGALAGLNLSERQVVDSAGKPTKLARTLIDYFATRAARLNREVEPNLMNAGEARNLFNELRAKLKPRCPIPLNKQKGKKKAPAYLTAIVNMLIEANARGTPCDYDPRTLTTITRDDTPLRTLARRVDGCFPSTINPVAVWEIKEYYYTTTFGSRVADGVYESLLDGMELEELREEEGIDVRHYLIVDAHYTWWDCGRSYLCRLFDMLHMQYVDEVLFGREIVKRLPVLVSEWAEMVRRRPANASRRVSDT